MAAMIKGFIPSLRWVVSLSLIFTVFFLVSCRSAGRQRPFGVFRLGKVAEHQGPQTFFPEFGLLLRRDEGGFYLMSTYCTYDLSPLTFKPGPGGGIFASSTTTSTYDFDGHVLSGPAKADLPYYELRLDSSVYGGPKDALYAYVGQVRPKNWRLKID